MIVGLDDRPDVVAVVPTLGRENGRLNRCIDSLRASTTSRRLAVLCVVNGPCLSGIASASHTYTTAGSYTAHLLNSAHADPLPRDVEVFAERPAGIAVERVDVKLNPEPV